MDVRICVPKTGCFPVRSIKKLCVRRKEDISLEKLSGYDRIFKKYQIQNGEKNEAKDKGMAEGAADISESKTDFTRMDSHQRVSCQRVYWKK